MKLPPIPDSYVGDVVRSVTAVAPDALQPKWLAKTWAGEFGSARYATGIHNVESTIEIGASTLSGYGVAEGHVLSGSTNIGKFWRSVQLHDNSRLEVHHGFLELRQSAQGTGFAKDFNAQAFERYADAGVNDVTVHAALDVGGYAWARQGFELLTPTATTEAERLRERAIFIRRLVDAARVDRSIQPHEFRAVVPKLIDRDGVMRPGVMTSIQELAAIPEIGPRVLLGSDWHGVRELSPTRNWWQPAGTRARGAANDAASGAAHLWPNDAVNPAAQGAVRAANDALPMPFHQPRMQEKLAQVELPEGLRTVIDDGRSYSSVELAGKPKAEAQYMLDVEDAGEEYFGSIRLNVGPFGTSDELHARAYFEGAAVSSADFRRPALAGIADALEGAGITRLRDTVHDISHDLHP